jgi:cation transport regulator
LDNGKKGGKRRNFMPYTKAFNNAWDEYSHPSDRREKGESHEEVAFRVAWAAVKKEYEKEGDRWVKKH